MKIFRITAYLLLFTLVLNLGDWPFVDEIFTEQQSQTEQILVQADNGLHSNNLRADPAPGSIYQSLMNLADMSRHVLVVKTSVDRATYSSNTERFSSTDLAVPERPPTLSLS